MSARWLSGAFVLDGFKYMACRESDGYARVSWDFRPTGDKLSREAFRRLTTAIDAYMLLWEVQPDQSRRADLDEDSRAAGYMHVLPDHAEIVIGELAEFWYDPKNLDSEQAAEKQARLNWAKARAADYGLLLPQQAVNQLNHLGRLASEKPISAPKVLGLARVPTSLTT